MTQMSCDSLRTPTMLHSHVNKFGSVQICTDQACNPSVTARKITLLHLIIHDTITTNSYTILVTACTTDAMRNAMMFLPAVSSFQG